MRRRSPPPSAAPVAESFVPGPAGSLRLAEPVGEAAGGLAVLLVHELGGRLEHWEALGAAPARGLRRIAVDLPGHGGSEPPAEGEATIAALGAALAAALDGAGLRRAVVVGHGLGALAAVALALARPRRVAGLVLVDPWGDQSRLPPGDVEATLAALGRDPAGELRSAYEELLGEAGQAVRERVLADLDAVDPALLGALAADAAGYPLADAVARWRGPLLVVGGGRNRTAWSLPRLLPDLPAESLPYDGHWLPLDRPDDLAGALERFLAPLARAGPSSGRAEGG